jgi:hypothetical protein
MSQNIIKRTFMLQNIITIAHVKAKIIKVQMLLKFNEKLKCNLHTHTHTRFLLISPNRPTLLTVEFQKCVIGTFNTNRV